MNPLNLFKLAKLTIEAYADDKRQVPSGRFEVQYNPESLSMAYKTGLQTEAGLGRSGGRAKFVRNEARKLNVRLIFDGTGVSDYGGGLRQTSVSQRVKRLLDLCRTPKGKTHEPNFLVLKWGAGVLGRGFPCRLASLDIQYTAFDRDGSPLHAELGAVFEEDRNPCTAAREDGYSSPDLTHSRLVIAGDTLPALCQEIYGDARYWLRVADHNGLNDVRALRPGATLLFPPLATAEAD